MNFVEIINSLPPHVAKDLEKRLDGLEVVSTMSAPELKHRIATVVEDVKADSLKSEPAYVQTMAGVLLDQVPVAVLEVLGIST